MGPFRAGHGKPSPAKKAGGGMRAGATRERTIGNYETLIDAYESGTPDARRVPHVRPLRAVDEMTRRWI